MSYDTWKTTEPDDPYEDRPFDPDDDPEDEGPELDWEAMIEPVEDDDVDDVLGGDQ